MEFETLYDNRQIAKIGFGTWTIGGRSHADLQIEEKSMAALRSALDLGYTHFDTAEMYADGYAEVLLGNAIRESSKPRESLFITSKILPSHLEYDEVLKACQASLKRLSMDYIDLYMIHWSTSNMPLEQTFEALNQLVREGKVRYLGVSNFDISLLKEAQKLSATPIVTNQIPYSLSDRRYVTNGVIPYCQQNNILVTAYSPVGEGRLTITPALEEIAKRYQASPFQIALAWLVRQPKVITIPMSFNPTHQLENLQAASINLTPEELEILQQKV